MKYIFFLVPISHRHWFISPHSHNHCQIKFVSFIIKLSWSCEAKTLAWRTTNNYINLPSIKDSPLHPQNKSKTVYLFFAIIIY